jgi:hypothetical protein
VYVGGANLTGVATPAYFFNGYIDDLRFTKGIARYTTPIFVVPSSPLATTQQASTYISAITGTATAMLTLQSTQPTQNASFVDSSSYNFPITRFANSTQGTFSPFSLTGWSQYFAPSNNYTLAGTANAVCAGNFTVEYWAYQTATPAGGWTFLNGSNPYVGISEINATTMGVYLNSGSATNFTVNTTVGVWYHIALVRNNNIVTLYKDGVSAGTTIYSATYGLSTSMIVGGGIGSWTGYLSNFRCVNGTAVYTANFVPPTSPLTAIAGTVWLVASTNRFVDGSSNNLSITFTGTPSVQSFSPFAPTGSYDPAVVGGSAYFDGTGDYLTVPNNAAFSLSADFTIECWWYPLDLSGSSNLWCIGDSRASYNGLLLYWSTGAGKLILYSNGANVVVSSLSTPINTWYHIAAVRSGSTVTFYINGASVGTATNTTTFTGLAVNGFAVCAEYFGSFSAGKANYMFGLRVVKGTAVYTAAFTPPTIPVTSTSNTSLLLNFVNTGVFDSTGRSDLETVADARVSKVQIKYGNGSMYFAGSGNYLLTPYSPNLVFGTADFTFECQLYWTGGNSENNLIMNNASGGFNLKLSATTSTNWALENSYVGQIADFGTAPTKNVWHHIAVTRSAGTLYAFIDGTQVFSGANSTNFTNTASWYIAGNGASLSLYITGYIDDLRITKGYARYTANFTPPANSFPTR